MRRFCSGPQHISVTHYSELEWSILQKQRLTIYIPSSRLTSLVRRFRPLCTVFFSCALSLSATQLYSIVIVFIVKYSKNYNLFLRGIRTKCLGILIF